MMEESFPESSSDESVFPRTFGPYVLVNPLGEGGMGRVYLALTRDRRGEHLYVVKRFGNPRARFTPAQILENQERFRHEADITKALCHPCIARTFYSVHQGPASYLVQEFIHGLTLDYLVSLINPQQMPVPLVAHIVAQIAGALHYVHEFRNMGLIHRDLTAENVMFSRAGEVKVIDFGIAKATVLDETLTRPHIIVGKPLWTAPEVAEGMKPDRRADLYALGLLFWHLLSGRNPESAINIETHALPPPSTLNPEVSAHLDGIVRKALRQDPNHRFQSAEEFLREVIPLIPKGYQGTKELAHLVVGYDLTRAMDYFNARVAKARPLLEQVASDRLPLLKLKRLIVAIASIAFFLAIGTALVFRATSSTLSVQNVSPPPISSMPSPPVPVPSEPPLPKVSEAIPMRPQTTPLASETPPPPRPSPRSRQSRVVNARAPHAEMPHEIVDANSQNPAPEKLLAAALEAINRSQLDQALDFAQLAAQHGAGPKAYILSARILSLKQDRAGAQAALETALRLSPGNRQATYLLEQLKQTNP
jgi:serine/threonine protein kinase